MPLLTATSTKSKKVAFNILLEENLFTEMRAYCDWAHISKPTEFILQAIHYVLANDKEWRRANKQADPSYES